MQLNSQTILKHSASGRLTIKRKPNHQSFWIFFNLSLSYFALSPSLSAQILPDKTLPVNSLVTPEGNTTMITGGTTAGGNLFHSFREFSLPTGNTAYFNNALSIENIITRVTGSSVSNIDGLIRANGNANLFLLNPNGIIFGPNAALNIGGSFLGTTADSVQFSDGNEYSATNPQAPPLLNISVPIGLQFGTNPGSIQVEGSGHQLSRDSETGATITKNRPVGLAVPSGETLALVGGSISLMGGNLTASQGRIELGSVGSGGLVTLNEGNPGWQLGYAGVENFQDIRLSGAASVDVSGAGAGNIYLQARQLTLSEGSLILALTEGDISGGSITVNTTDSVELIGTTPDGFATSLLVKVQPNAPGNGADLWMETGHLSIRDGGQAGSVTFGVGDSGNLTVVATDSVEVIGTSADGEVTSMSINSNSKGNGGDLRIETGHLSIRDGGQVGSVNFGAGDAGNITVVATDFVEVIGTSVDGETISVLSASALSDSTGNAGDLRIETAHLSILNGGDVKSETFGGGNAGNLTIVATDSVEIIGTSPDGQSSSLSTSTLSDTTGNAGDLRIETARLMVRDQGQVNSSTYGGGNAGNLTIVATDSVEVIGTTPNVVDSSSLITATAPGSTGNAGDLRIETGRLIIRDGAQVGSFTAAVGDGGILTVVATDFVELVGAGGLTATGLGVVADFNSTGNAGDLRIEAGRLIVRNGAQVNSGTAGTGNGGNLTVVATDSVEVIGTTPDGQNPSALIAGTQSDSTGNGGNLRIETGRLIIRDGAQVSSGTIGAGNAGTLTVIAMDSVELIGVAPSGEASSGLFVPTTPGSTGNGGNLRIETGRLILRDGAQVVTGTAGAGDAGTLTVIATDSVELIGTEPNTQFGSSLIAGTRRGSTGNGGNLSIQTPRLSVQDTGRVSVSSSGTGAAGNLLIDADSVRLSNSASVSAETLAGNESRGNITLNASDIQLRRGSNITTNAQGTAAGGNITINTDTLAALENSDISANAENARGGQVFINAQGIFGTTFRESASDTTSDITASSALGASFGGTVSINTPDIDPSSGLVELAANFIDVNNQIADQCTHLANSSFAFIGRGGLPPTPFEPLESSNLSVNLATPVLERNRNSRNFSPNLSQSLSQSRSANVMTEAQGWVMGADGAVMLVAQPPRVEPGGVWYQLASCSAME